MSKSEDELLAALDALNTKYAHLSAIDCLRVPTYLDEFWEVVKAEANLHTFVLGLFTSSYGKDLDEADLLIHKWYENKCKALGVNPVLVK